MRPGGPQFIVQHAHHGHPLAWLLIVIVLVAVVGFAMYVLVKASRGLGAGPALAGVGATPSTDVAVELVRARYAKGEIDRDEFVRVATDLGAPPPATAT
jgi:uncharacterized membrane protein